MFCADCGHKYRRQVWSKYGEKSAVWRCEDRLKLGKKSTCIHSPTLKEDDLHKAIMKAINSIIDNKEDFISRFRNNVLEVISNYMEESYIKQYDEQINILQNQMLNLIERNAKFRAVSKDYDNEYKLLHDKIESLKQANVDEMKSNHIYEEKIDKANVILYNINPKLLTFDQELVKRLIESIKVKRNNEIEIRFYSGIVVNEKLESEK